MDAGDKEVGSWVDCVLVVVVLAWWVTTSVSVSVSARIDDRCLELTGQRARSWGRRGSWRHRRGLGRASESAHVRSRGRLQYPTVSHAADQARVGLLVIVILDGGRMFLTMPIVARIAALCNDVVVTFVAALLPVVRVHVSHRIETRCVSE